MRVLVLGGTGAMGEHLVQLLADEKIETYVTSRKKLDSFGTVQYIQGNAHDEVFITHLLQEKFDVIIDFMVYTTLEFANKVDSYLNNTDQYIFLSSARVYANSDKPLTEDSPRLLDVAQDKEYLKTDEYALAKARQEDLLINNKNRNWTIIRPYITYSNIRLQLGVLEKEDWLYRALYGHKVLFPIDLMEKKTTLTYGYDVALGIKSVIGKENTLSNAFHITQDNSITWSNVWKLYKETIRDNTETEPLIMLCDMNQFENVHKGHYQIHYDRMYDRVFSNDKIKQYLDTSSFTQSELGIKKCLSELISNLSNLKEMIRYGSEGSKDRITKEYWKFSDIPSLKKKLKYTIRRIGL